MTTSFYPLDHLLARRERRARPSGRAGARPAPRARAAARPPSGGAPAWSGQVGSPKRRCAALLVAFALLFGYLAFRIVELQVLAPERFLAQAQDQTERAHVIVAPRGRILDRNGVELAVSVPQRTLYTDPRTVTDPVGTARLLAPIIGVDEATLLTKLTADNAFGYLRRQMPDEVSARVEQLMADPDAPMDGVYLLTEPKRFLPAGEVARGLLGRTDVDGVGIAGIERMLDEVLTGTDGRLESEQAPGGRTIATGRRELTPAVPGQDIRLTIDRAIQFETERALVAQVEEMHAAGAMAVLSVPATGEILAMASVARDETSGRILVTGNNAPLTTVYEPGSIMKLVTMAGIIEDGVLAPDAEVDVPDSLLVGDHVFTEYKPHGLGSWPIGDIIRRSSNTGTIQLAQMLGEERLEHWFRSFGFGERTGIGFPDEAAGVVHPAEDWSSTSIGSMPIGQGISVTPVQMLAAYNAVANDGVLVPLRIIDGQVDQRGVLHRTDAAAPRRVVSAGTAAVLTDMLRSVVVDGTGTRAEVPGYPAAGKTGTALKPYGGGYTGPDGIAHYMGSFVGFAPATDAGLSMIVIVDDPRGGIYTGGLVAAPVFSELGKFALRRLEVPSVALAAPDGEATGQAAAAPTRVRALPAARPEPALEDDAAVQVAAAEGAHVPDPAGR